MTTVQNNVVSPSLMEAMNPKAKTAKGTAAEAQDRFMTLLVTQMKNQDPLNPLDNAQVTSQLAQLSTVTGIDKLNTTVEGLKGSYQSSQTLQAASLIGRGVLTAGSGMELDKGKALFGVEITEPADNVKVTVLDASKNVVRMIDLGPQDIGTLPLGWDGMSDKGVAAKDGHYTLEVTATRGGKKIGGATPLSFATVSSVSTGAQGVKLNTANLGALELTDVRQFL